MGLTDASVERGTYKNILDLDGRKHPTRDKSDIAVREKDLGFAFRAVDRDWERISYHSCRNTDTPFCSRKDYVQIIAIGLSSHADS